MELKLSKVIQGHMRLCQWGLSQESLYAHTSALIELGINTFDHADIYGNYECEKAFGVILKKEQHLRSEIKLISKCGIKLLSDKFPERSIKHYEFSAEAIINSVNQSLQNLNTDYLDVLLLHRPSPLADPNEVSEAFDKLKTAGKVLHFGVSNYSIEQFNLLESRVNVPLEFNQIEISPYNLTAIETDLLNFMMRKNIMPMAWSPFGGGKISNPTDEKGVQILKQLTAISEELNLKDIDSVLYAWLFKHPARIVPIIGTGNLERAKLAIKAQNIELTTEQWFRIYTASLGCDVA